MEPVEVGRILADIIVSISAALLFVRPQLKKIKERLDKDTKEVVEQATQQVKENQAEWLEQFAKERIIRDLEENTRLSAKMHMLEERVAQGDEEREQQRIEIERMHKNAESQTAENNKRFEEQDRLIATLQKDNKRLVGEIDEGHKREDGLKTLLKAQSEEIERLKQTILVLETEKRMLELFLERMRVPIGPLSGETQGSSEDQTEPEAEPFDENAKNT